MYSVHLNFPTLWLIFQSLSDSRDISLLMGRWRFIRITEIRTLWTKHSSSHCPVKKQQLPVHCSSFVLFFIQSVCPVPNRKDFIVLSRLKCCVVPFVMRLWFSFDLPSLTPSLNWTRVRLQSIFCVLVANPFVFV